MALAIPFLAAGIDQLWQLVKLYLNITIWSTWLIHDLGQLPNCTCRRCKLKSDQVCVGEVFVCVDCVLSLLLRTQWQPRRLKCSKGKLVAWLALTSMYWEKYIYTWVYRIMYNSILNISVSVHEKTTVTTNYEGYYKAWHHSSWSQRVDLSCSSNPPWWKCTLPTYPVR